MTYMTSVSKNLYIDKLDYVVGEQNNKYHRATTMKLVNVKLGTYIDFDVANNDKDSKFKVSDLVRVSK